MWGHFALSSSAERDTKQDEVEMQRQGWRPTCQPRTLEERKEMGASQRLRKERMEHASRAEGSLQTQELDIFRDSLFQTLNVGCQGKGT